MTGSIGDHNLLTRGVFQNGQEKVCWSSEEPFLGIPPILRCVGALGD